MEPPPIGRGILLVEIPAIGFVLTAVPIASLQRFITNIGKWVACSTSLMICSIV